MDNELTITVDGTAILRGMVDGVSRYAINVLPAIADLMPAAHFIVIGFMDDPKDWVPPRKNISTLFLPVPRRIYQVIFRTIRPLAIDSLLPVRPEYHLALNFTCFPFIKKTKTITFIHDLAFRDLPESVTEKNRIFLEKRVPWSLKQSSSIAVISKFTEDRLRSLYPDHTLDKTFIYAPGGIDERFFKNHSPKDKAIVKNLYKLPDKFLLTVGTMEPRKNLEFLFEVFSKIPKKQQSEYPLKVSGKVGWGEQKDVSNVNIELLGFVDDIHLPIVYSLASYFISTSKYEGVGLPVLESMASGTPVIVSDIPVYREFAGKDAQYVNINDSSESARVMSASIGEPKIDVKKAARRYTWSLPAKNISRYIKNGF